MKFLNNTKKTRFKLAVVLEIFLGSALMYSMKSDMEELAGTLVNAMLTVGTGYILGDTYRKSNDEITNEDDAGSI